MKCTSLTSLKFEFNYCKIQIKSWRKKTKVQKYLSGGSSCRLQNRQRPTGYVESKLFVTCSSRGSQEKKKIKCQEHPKNELEPDSIQAKKKNDYHAIQSRNKVKPSPYLPWTSSEARRSHQETMNDDAPPREGNWSPKKDTQRAEEEKKKENKNLKGHGEHLKMQRKEKFSSQKTKRRHSHRKMKND